MLSGRIGHYLIEDQIGSGGMGVVYRARDTLLDRPVAIKATRADSAQALKRLRKEARAAAALDHPYICKVFELVEHDDQLLIVMEYLEGETLSHRLESGVLEPGEAVRYGREVAEALAAVHSHGIVHRDIKPSNIMISGGHAKVMDFGVVRVEHQRDENPNEATTSLTPDGAIVGTPYYMAPEQIAGDPIGPHSDVWALGVVLYESLSGCYPFLGDSKQEYLRNLATQEPFRLRDVAADVPGPIAEIVMRCLVRDPAGRFRSSDELRRELHRVSRLISAETLIDKGVLTAPVRRSQVIVGVGVGIALALMLALSVINHNSTIFPPSIVVEQERLVTTWASAERQGRLSPDGKSLSFVSDHDGGERVWRQPIEGGTPVALTPTDDSLILSHRWSPDSGEIAYVTHSDKEVVLKVLPAEGGETLRSAALGPWPGDRPQVIRWYQDALYLLISNSLWRFSSDLTARELIGPRDLKMVGVDVCPHEDRLVYEPLRADARLTVTQLDGSDSRILTPLGTYDSEPRWGPEDQLFFRSNRSGTRAVWLMAEIGSPPVQISSGIRSLSDLSPEGTVMVLEQSSEQADLWSFDPASEQNTQLTSGSASDFWPSESASVLAFQRVRAGSPGRADPFEADIYLAKEGQLSALTPGYLPLLSPDGRQLAFLRRSELTGRHQLWVSDLRHGGERLLTDSLAFVRFRILPPMDRLPAALVWSGNDLLAGLGSPSSRDASIIRFTPEDGTIREILGGGRWSRLSDLHVSPDGERLTFVAEEGRSRQLITLTLGTGDPEEVYTEPGSGATYLYCPGWIDDRRVVFIRSLRAESRQMMEVFVAATDSNRIDRIFRGEGFPATAQLGPGAKLYFTAPNGDAHNLWKLDLQDGSRRQLTDNQATGVTFSTPSITSDGRIVYTYHANNLDLKVLRLSGVEDSP